MTDKIDIPEWAWDRAVELTRELGGPCIEAYHLKTIYSGRAFALYIMQHETAPVDPLLIEAREIAAKDAENDRGNEYYAACYRRGDGDDWPVLLCTYAALKSREDRND